MKHLLKNLRVALIGLHIFFWHFLHAIIKCKYTSHDYWGIEFINDSKDNSSQKN